MKPFIKPPSVIITEGEDDWLKVYAGGISLKGGIWKRKVSEMSMHRHLDDHYAKSIWQRIRG